MILDILKEGSLQSLATVSKLALILLFVMVAIEYANHFHVLEKISSWFKWLPRCLGMSPQAAFPLIVGLAIGVFYGAAVILEYNRQGYLGKKDIVLCAVFLAVNHSVLEDNLLFATVGADLLVIIPLRFLLAFVVTRAASAYLDRKENRESQATAAN